MRVEEILNPRVSAIEEDRTVVEALRLLCEKTQAVLPVTKSGRCVGILSLGVIEAALLPVFRGGSVDSALLEEFCSKTVGTLMAREAPLLELNMELVEAIDLFLQTEYSALPVIDPETKTVCGVVSAREIVQAARTLFDD